MNGNKLLVLFKIIWTSEKIKENALEVDYNDTSPCM